MPLGRRAGTARGRLAADFRQPVRTSTAAVDLAGVYGILVLFGVVPALMAWGSRYGAAAPDADDAAPRAVPGGRASLGAIAGFATAIIGLEHARRRAGVWMGFASGM